MPPETRQSSSPQVRGRRGSVGARDRPVVEGAGAAASVPASHGSSGLLCTFIHGDWYDLSSWAQQHPGGPVALSLAAGRDGTVLFESSHPFCSRSRLLALMAPYRCSPARSAQLCAQYPSAASEATMFTFSEGTSAAPARSGRSSSSSSTTTTTTTTTSAATPAAAAFEVEVKQCARAYFEGEAARRGVSLREATKAPPERWLTIALLALAFVGLGVAPLLQGQWHALLTCPTLCWLFMVNYWHDASHFAMSTSWRVNWALLYVAPWFSSPLIWWHQHVIGHHAYTNVAGRDPDLYHAPSMWRFTRDVRWRATHGWQAYTSPVLWALSVPTLLLLKPLVMLRSKAFNRVVPMMQLTTLRVVLHLIGRLLVLCTLYVWPFYAFGFTAKAVLFSAVPISVFSLLFMACSQVNHHSAETSSAGELATAAAPVNWYSHQAATSHNIAPASSLAFWVSGGLNLQVEHHLFPSVNHWHLPALAPLVQRVARKHGVPYPVSHSIAAAFHKLFEHLAEMAVRPAGKGGKEVRAAH